MKKGRRKSGSKQAPLNQILSDFDFVAIVFERFGAFQRDLAGLAALASSSFLPRKNSSALAARQGIGATPPMTTCALLTTPALLSTTVATATMAWSQASRSRTLW